MTSIIFYALCLLYILSTVTITSDLLGLIIEVSNNFICKHIIFLSVVQEKETRVLSFELHPVWQSVYFRDSIVQMTVDGFCDFIAQSTLVHISFVPTSIIYFIHLNLQRSTVVGSCGVKISEL